MILVALSSVFHVSALSSNIRTPAPMPSSSLDSSTPDYIHHIPLPSLISPVAVPFDLSDVRIDTNSFWGQQQQKTFDYLMMLNLDSMLFNFRVTAGLPSPGIPLGGWEDPTCELRGHFVGHYLSASCFMYASTNDDELKAKMDDLVIQLGYVQTKLGSGYLSAFPTTFFDRLESLQTVWAPYYTIHKILAGLWDQYSVCGNQHALEIAVKMADYFVARISKVVANKGLDYWQSILNTEWGGMNEVLLHLYTATNTSSYLTTSQLFDHYVWSVPLGKGIDNLNNNHANTHIPEVIGDMTNYEVTGNKTHLVIAQTFFQAVTQHHSWVTGGSNEHEFWGVPDQMGDSLTTNTQESCTQYNILKVARYFFQLTGDVSYLDFYELAITNGIVGNQRNAGEYIYMLPLGGGGIKKGNTDDSDWGGPLDSFWCCYGTLLESFSKLGDSIYFHSPDNISTLFVNLYVSSSLQWGKIKITQVTDFPVVSSSTFLVSTPTPSKWTLKLRVPKWANTANKVTVNGKEVEGVTPGSWFAIEREWADGDLIEVWFPMSILAQHIQDNRSKFNGTAAVLYGPVVLVGLTNSTFLPVDWSKIQTWMHRVDFGSLQFEAKANDGSLIPFMALYPILEQQYTVHFRNNVTLIPYSSGGSLIPTSSRTDYDCAGGSAIVQNPILALRSGQPGETTSASFDAVLWDRVHKIDSISLAYSYCSGYSNPPTANSEWRHRKYRFPAANVAANFTLSVVNQVTGQTRVLYQSPPLWDYLFDLNPSNYSPPVVIKATNLNLDVSDVSVLTFLFENNDRNVQLKLGMPGTVYWTN